MPNSNNKININGDWHSINDIKINISDEWKSVNYAYIYSEDSWNQFWSSVTDYGDSFVFNIQTSGTNDAFTFPLSASGDYNFNVDWGDGSPISTITTYNEPDVTHTYSNQGPYKIICSGTLKGWSFHDVGDTLLMRDIENWGMFQPSVSGVGGIVGAFEGCSNLTISATDTLDLTGMTNISKMFKGCMSITQIPNSGSWDTSSVTEMWEIFYDCRSLTSIDVKNWNTSNVTNMLETFFQCYALTSLDLSGWDVSKSTDYHAFAMHCLSLQTIDTTGWVLSEATTLYEMFYNCQNLTTISGIETWDLSKCTRIDRAFAQCYKLDNIDTSAWNITNKLTTIKEAFINCFQLTTVDVSNWDMSGCNSFYFAFYHCDSLTTLNVSNWVVSEVLTMACFVAYCGNLTTLDVSTWNTAKLTSSYYAFYNCGIMQNIILHNWNITNVTTMERMLSYSNNAISNSEYDAILINWSSQVTPKSDVIVHFGDAKYSAGDAATARGVLTETYGWTIYDGGQIID